MNNLLNYTIFALVLDFLPGYSKSGSSNATSDTLTTILNIIFGTLAAVSIFVITLAGFRYVISHGDPKAIEQAKNAILYAVIGLIVAASASAIVNFVLGSV